MSRATVDTALTTIRPALEAKQDACFIANGRYGQLYATHSEVPDGQVAISGSLVRDIDITIELPGTLDFAFRVDEIQGSNEYGWVLRVWVKEGGIDYSKAIGYGLGSVEAHDWVETTIGPID